MRLRFVFLWVSPLVLASLILGFLTHRAIAARENRTYWNETIAERVLELVGREYVDEITEERGRELFFAAMEGYLSALDDFSTFYDPEDRRQMEEDTRGQFGGVGVLVRPSGEEPGLMITGLRIDDPAEKSGIQLGDRMVTVDEHDITKLSLSEITPLIKGMPGTPVTLGIVRNGKTLSFEMERSEIKIDSITGVRIVEGEAGVGYFRVSSFQENTGSDAREAILWLRERGARSFIVDLRMNTGGVLEKGAVALVDLFLEQGTIVRTEGRVPGSRRVYAAHVEKTIASNEPLVVLVDGESASASEVVAGALQDHRRAILLGERTYGKFLVQSIHRLPDLEVALQLTTARYYTPYGRWLQRRMREGIRGGLLPDVVVKRTQEETDRLREEIHPRQHGLAMRVAEESEHGEDPQLDRAVDILRDHAVIQIAVDPRVEEPK